MSSLFALWLRKIQPEPRPSPRLRFYPYLASHSLHRFPYDGQSDACPLITGFHSLKDVKYPLLLICRNTDAVVRKPKPHRWRTLVMGFHWSFRLLWL